MKNKLISFLLSVCLLFGMLSLPIPASAASVAVPVADPIDEPYQVQDLTGPRFKDCTLTFADHDLLYYDINEKGKIGLLDVFGNTVLAPVYTSLYALGNQYFGVHKDGKGSLFYRGTQLIPFYSEYVHFSRGFSCFRAELSSGDYDYAFLDQNGKNISIPNVEDQDWKVIDIIPYKAILLYKPAKYWYDENTFDGIVHNSPKYRIIDWAGNTIESETRQALAFLDENTYSVSGNMIYECRYFSGGVVETCPDPYWEVSGPDSLHYQYKILGMGSMDEKTYFLFDSDYNLICPLNASPTALTPVIFLSESTFLVRHQNAYSVLMNYKGEVLAELPGVFYFHLGVESSKAKEAPGADFITCDNTNCYLFKADGTLIATIEGATAPETAGYYFSVEYEKYRYGLYDYRGNFLFEYTRDSNIKILDGVILQEKENKTAILDKKGNPITDYQFTTCRSVGTYGLIRATLSDRNGFYLVNGAGEILNSRGFDSQVDTTGSYYCYSIEGQSGILRIVSPEDDLFLDVPKGTWYCNSVEACATMGLFNGTAPARFSPDGTMTRAMLVTVLWRLDGKPTPQTPANFTDVANNTWYSTAVAWASENGIVNGVGKGRFNPDGNVTREQIATILCRYADSKGVDTSATTELSSYPDYANVSGYALKALSWANEAGLINGIKSGSTVYLRPQANATRAQVATILIRYIENILGK